MRALALVAVSTLRAPSRLVRHADDLPTVEEALASAVMDAQGPRPTYSSFASSIPADHPFADG